MTAEIRHDMEQRILAAAEELFLEKGFSLTSTTAIAKKVGCTQALIHYYFRTKEKLVETIFQRKIMLFLSAFTKIDEESQSFEERLRRKIESHFDILMANPRLPFLILNEIAENPKRSPFVKNLVKSLPKEIFERFAAELAGEIAAGRIRKMEPADIVITLVSLNAMLFAARPILMAVFDMDEARIREMTLHRRAEHVAIIMRSLRP